MDHWSTNYVHPFRFASDQGDHVTLLNVYRGFIGAQPARKPWCQDNFLIFRNLDYAANVRNQLAGLTEKAKLEKTSCEGNTELLRRALLDGLSENLAELQRDDTYVAVIILLFFSCSSEHAKFAALLVLV